MDETIIERINDQAESYIKEPSSLNRYEIERSLELLKYQSWYLKYKLRLIENPNRIFKDREFQQFREEFSCENAFSKYHLIIPLLIHLFVNYNNVKPALETSLSFMNECKHFLSPGDFAKTKTGVQRFITNTRFASLELRKFGFLRSDKKHFYKNWQLSLFGFMVAAKIYYSNQNNIQLFLFNYNAWDESYKFSRTYLQRAIDQIIFGSFLDILKSIIEDEDLKNYLKILKEDFTRFSKAIQDVLIEGFNKGSTETINLLEYLDTFNNNKIMSDLADTIVIKKQTEVNMEDVFKILKLI